MPAVATLNNLDELKRSGFGWPPPRHGLKLLYWFVTECVSFDANDQTVWQCDPKAGAFGFHRFWNHPDNNGLRLLSDQHKPFYMVGNLNSPNAEQLPAYVRERLTTFQDGSNKDRVIISLRYDKVYVTEHINRTDFSSKATYYVSKGLLKMIRRMRREEFLNKVSSYDSESEDSEDSDVPISASLLDVRTSNVTPERRSTNQNYWRDEEEAPVRGRKCLDCCTIL